MDYDIEREKRKSEEIRIAMRDCFPLVPEHELPWAASQLKHFLSDRIAKEIELGTNHSVQSIARVLCEVTRPKTHLIDMVRNTVTMAKQVEPLMEKVKSLNERIDVLNAQINDLKEDLRAEKTKGGK